MTLQEIDEFTTQFDDEKELRERLVEEGLKEYKCECCGLTEWMGKPISLQLHHINGNNRDNRL